jgi:putative membrane protein
MNTGTILTLFIAIGAGAIATFLACVPGLHIYNVLGLILWTFFRFMPATPLAPEIITAVIVSMISAYAIGNSIPAILLAAPDESALHTVLPGQKMLQEGKGINAVMLTTYGSTGALLAILLTMPILPKILPVIYAVVRPHTHWIIWAIILFMILSEWPKSIPPARKPLARFLLANQAAATGLMVFLLSGMLGFILFFRSPLPSANAFLNLMPAFVGLFTLPWLLLNACSNSKPPPQRPQEETGPTRRASLRHGTLAGILGGGLAAFLPGITGGIGGMLAGHATALRNSEAFLVSQGASKTIYYTGGVLLFFMPGLHLTRGGGGWMLRSTVSTGSAHLYWLAGGAALLGGASAIILQPRMIKGALALAERTGYRALSIASAGIVIALVALFSGWMGLGVMLVATGIGIIPILHGTRRMHGLGVILLPIACSMSGLAPAITRLLHL